MYGRNQWRRIGSTRAVGWASTEGWAGHSHCCPLSTFPRFCSALKHLCNAIARNQPPCLLKHPGLLPGEIGSRNHEGIVLPPSAHLAPPLGRTLPRAAAAGTAAATAAAHVAAVCCVGVVLFTGSVLAAAASHAAAVGVMAPAPCKVAGPGRLSGSARLPQLQMRCKLDLVLRSGWLGPAGGQEAAAQHGSSPTGWARGRSALPRYTNLSKAQCGCAHGVSRAGRVLPSQCKKCSRAPGKTCMVYGPTPRSGAQIS